MMNRKNILFLHHGFPGQFFHWAAALATRGHRVIFLSSKAGGQIPGVQCLAYEAQDSRVDHVLLDQYGRHVEAGCAVWRAMEQLKRQGFTADTVISHADFGVGLFVKQAFPACRLIVYCEWFFRCEGNEWEFDPVDAAQLLPGHIMKLQLSNAGPLLVMQQADLLVTPSEWQRSRFPCEYQASMLVLPDGINTSLYSPPPARQADTPLITYVSRTMEPFRGFDKFMEALSLLMQEDKQCKALLVGQTHRHEYSSAPPDGKTYAQLFLERFPLPADRVRFTGWIGEAQLARVLQASTVHVYLTRPFVLSWSFLQALSTGCAVVASQTPPVQEEVAKSGDKQIVQLVDYFSPQDLATVIDDLQGNTERRAILGRNSRQFIENNHSIQQWLPEHCRLVEQ